MPTDVSALTRRTEVVEHREGGDPSSSRKSPGRTVFDAITLERGITHDQALQRLSAFREMVRTMRPTLTRFGKPFADWVRARAQAEKGETP